MKTFSRPDAARGFAFVVAIAAFIGWPATTAVLIACNDGPPPTSAPGNNYVDDSMQDAVAHYSQDAGIYDVIPPMGAMDAGYVDGSYTDANLASVGYADVGSPATACASCTCSQTTSFCIENGLTTTVSGAAAGGQCPMAPAGKLQIGCNPIPAACAANPTCGCLLDSVQPPVSCYPECTSTLGYFDVFCNVP